MVERLEAECEGTLCEVGGPVKETADNKHRNGLETFSPDRLATSTRGLEPAQFAY